MRYIQQKFKELDMKKKIFLLVALAHFTLESMDEPSVKLTEKYEQPQALWAHRGDFRTILHAKVFSIAEGPNEQENVQEKPQEEVFDRYFCDLQETASYDDVGQFSLVRSSLFLQLAVSASKATGARLAAFQELLAKIKKDDFVKIGSNQLTVYNNVLVSNQSDELDYLYGNVHVHENLIGITKKDLCHRLLSCISTGHTNSWVNGKKVRLDLRAYETESDKIANQKIKEEHAKLPKQEWRWSQGIEPLSASFHYSGQRLLADYFFETDAEHHNMILKEFVAQYLLEHTLPTQMNVPANFPSAE